MAEQRHTEFPLSIFAYSRKTVQEDKWDGVTSKCRGIIINRWTGEIVSRPFEKFYNYGSPPSISLDSPYNNDLSKEPIIWEKLDGFLSILYTWAGIDYIASKGSFHSPHAKWATAWLRERVGNSLGVPEGYTAVFEGLHPDFRIVVNYGDRKELVLLALIHNKTGEETAPAPLKLWAASWGLSSPKQINTTLEAVRLATMKDDHLPGIEEEGYVLTWYRMFKPPFRLKLKFIEYLRLHRMVTGVSPKRIWDVLSNGLTSEVDEYIKNSTSWFSKFVQKWIRALTCAYKVYEAGALSRYSEVKEDLEVKYALTLANGGGREFAEIRKAYALRFTAPENKEFAPILFALLDGKDIRPIIWKMIRPLTAGKKPLVDAHNT